jgi:hypothetical protein
MIDENQVALRAFEEVVAVDSLMDELQYHSFTAIETIRCDSNVRTYFYTYTRYVEDSQWWFFVVPLKSPVRFSRGIL